MQRADWRGSCTVFSLCLNLYWCRRWIDSIQCVACVAYVNKCCVRFGNGSNWFSVVMGNCDGKWKKGKEGGLCFFLFFFRSSSNISFLAYVRCRLRSKPIESNVWKMKPTNDKVIAEQMRSAVFGFRHEQVACIFALKWIQFVVIE